MRCIAINTLQKVKLIECGIITVYFWICIQQETKSHKKSLGGWQLHEATQGFFSMICQIPRLALSASDGRTQEPVQQKY